MDELSVDANSVQEDEFALLSLGVPSVYRAFLDPRRISSLGRWLEPEAWLNGAAPGWDDEWLAFLGDVQAALPDPRARLVLKSPTHSFRVHTIVGRFPQSRFVWLVREPMEIFFSCRRMWHAMFARYALWKWDEDELDEFLLRAFESAGRCLAWAIAELPRDRLAVVDQKSVATQPQGTLAELNRRLGLWPESTIRSGNEARPEVPARLPVREYRQENLPHRARSGVAALRAIHEQALASHGG